MAKTNFTNLTADLDNVQKLDDLPNAVGGLTAAQLKAVFDQAGDDIKSYLNGTLLAELASETSSDSGASKIGIEEIIGIAGATNVQDALSAVLASAQAGVVTDGSVYTKAILDDAVTTPKIANGAVTWEKIAAGAVTNSKTDFSTGLGIGGTLTQNGQLILKSGVTYGNSTTGQTPTAGRIFFVKL